MASPLDYISSEVFRKKLITRNLVPYAKSPYKATPPITYEVIQSDLAVIDSPDGLIDNPTFANNLYPLNIWGADGGFKQAPDPTGLNNTVSNQGEYGPGQQDARIISQANRSAFVGWGNNVRPYLGLNVSLPILSSNSFLSVFAPNLAIKESLLNNPLLPVGSGFNKIDNGVYDEELNVVGYGWEVYKFLAPPGIEFDTTSNWSKNAAASKSFKLKFVPWLPSGP